MDARLILETTLHIVSIRYSC